jgi:hypothetical protein
MQPLLKLKTQPRVRPVSLSLSMIKVSATVGSAKASRREPKTCLARVFNFKLDSFGDVKYVPGTHACTHLKLKTRPRFRPVGLGLSVATVILVHTYENTFAVIL